MKDTRYHKIKPEIPFEIDSKADINNTRLLSPVEIHEETAFLNFGGRLKKLLHSRCEKNRKYSSEVIIRHKKTNEVFTIYMCYGKPRIGGKPWLATSFGDLLYFLNPKYTGCAGMSYNDLPGKMFDEPKPA